MSPHCNGGSTRRMGYARAANTEVRAQLRREPPQRDPLVARLYKIVLLRSPSAPTARFSPVTIPVPSALAIAFSPMAGRERMWDRRVARQLRRLSVDDGKTRRSCDRCSRCSDANLRFHLCDWMADPARASAARDRYGLLLRWRASVRGRNRSATELSARLESMVPDRGSARSPRSLPIRQSARSIAARGRSGPVRHARHPRDG